MALNPLGRARRQQCITCPFRTTIFPDGRQWAEFCAYDPAAPDSLSGNRGTWTTLTPEFYDESDPTACASGRWAGLAPADVEIDAERARAYRIEEQKLRLVPVLVETLVGLSDSVVTAQLQKAVTAELLEPEVAVEVKLGVESRTSNSIPKK